MPGRLAAALKPANIWTLSENYISSLPRRSRQKRDFGAFLTTLEHPPSFHAIPPGTASLWHTPKWGVPGGVPRGVPRWCHGLLEHPTIEILKKV